MPIIRSYFFRRSISYYRRHTDRRYPAAKNDEDLADIFAEFFVTKIERIRHTLLTTKDAHNSQDGLLETFDTCGSTFSIFNPLTDDDVLGLVCRSVIKSCSLDPIPASIMRKCYKTLIPVFRRIINLSLASGDMPDDLKVAMLLPLTEESEC